MKKYKLLMAVAGVGLLSSAWSQTIVDTDFSSYSDGDLAGQESWAAVPNTGANAFSVSGGVAATEPVSASFLRNTGPGNYVYWTVLDTSAVDNQWTGTMDFQFSMSTNAGWQIGDAFRIGTSTAATNGLLPAANNQVVIGVVGSTWTKFEINAYDAAGAALHMISVDPEVVGFVPNAPAAPASDNLRLNWSIRKARGTGLFEVSCSLQNLDTATNIVGSSVYVEKAAAWASSDAYHVMGHCPDAHFWVTKAEQTDIALDALAIEKSSVVPPPMPAPTVAATPGNNTVTLSWGLVGDAVSYEISRSLSSNGTYAVVDTVATSPWIDSAVSTGTEYFYKVTAKSPGLSDAVSGVVSAIPFSAATGTIIDTSFQSPEFANGDLAGQDLWSAVAVSDPQAFNVDAAGNGYAETATFAGGASTNQVVYGLTTSNTVGNAWSGTLDFSLSVEPNGSFRTNIVAGVTNIHEVAELGGGYEGFMFGLTANPDQRLDPKGKDDLLFTVRHGGNDGRIDIGFNMYNWNANIVLTLDRKQLGWDPNWYDRTADNAPDFVSDMISLDYVIRKSSNGGYYATVEANIGTNTYAGTFTYSSNHDAWARPDDASAAAFLSFGMSHAASDPARRVNVSIDALSLVHADSSAVPVTPPYGIGTALGDAAITLSWLAGGEQASFNVYRAETNGGPYTLLASAISASPYTDTGLVDKRTYFYVLTGVYTGAVESAYSKQVHARALGRTIHMAWEGDMNTSGNQYVTGISAGVTNGSVIFYEGTSPGQSVIAPANTWYTGPTLRGVVQKPVAATGVPQVQVLWNGGARFNNAVGSSSLYWIEGAPLDATSQTVSLEIEQTSGSGRAAIRNGTTWYISQTTLSANRLIPDVLQENWAMLDKATAGSSSLMTATGASFVPGSTLGLNNITALGQFRENCTASDWFYYMRLLYGSSVTAYEAWADLQGIFNDDAVPLLDFDNDGLDNVTEWGLGGDPADGNDVGITARRTGVDGGGNFLYIYPRLKSASRPTYNVMGNADLLYGSFQVLTEGVDFTEVSSGGNWAANRTDFEAVTNAIPTAESAMFIKLGITE